jgi:hypothetical protein
MPSYPCHGRSHFISLTQPFFRRCMVFALFALSLTSVCHAAGVTLAWNAASGTVVGYKVYQGTASQQYTTVTTIDNLTQYSVSGLTNGTKYYFAVKAYNTYGDSGYSNELTYTVPANATAPVATGRSITTTKNTRVYSKMIATDADGDTLTYSIVTKPTKGTVVVRNTATGSFYYTPYTGITGTDSFTFRANDGKLNSNIATVKVTITATTATSAVSVAALSSLDTSPDSDVNSSEDVAIVLEAEDGQLQPSMAVLFDADASSGHYIETLRSVESVADARLDSGMAEYVFDVPASGTYRIWGRVQSKDVHHNGLYIGMDSQPFVDWETAMGGEGRWVWSAVKADQESKAMSFALSKGQHALTIKPKDDGVRIDQILITGRPNYLGSTVYEDGEHQTTLGWKIAEGSLDRATVTNVFDETCGSYVMELAGTNLRNEYVLMTDELQSWDDESQPVLEWSMASTRRFAVYVDVDTTDGKRYLVYSSTGRDHLGRDGQVHLTLGRDLTDGQWHTFARDLQADLQRFQPSATITRVNSFGIRGGGRVDNVSLR